LQKYAGRLGGSATGRTLLKSVLASVPLGIVAAIGNQFLNIHSRPLQFIGLGFVSLIAVWAYYFAARYMKMPETAYMDRVFDRLQKKKAAPNP